MKTKYLVMDMRAIYDFDRAIVMSVEDNLKEAKRMAKDMGGCVYEAFLTGEEMEVGEMVYWET